MKFTCNTCGEIKPITEFYKDKACKFGIRPKCKKCTGFVVAQWRSKNPEKIKGYKKSWENNNPGYMKAYRKANKNLYKELHKKWRFSNPDKILAYLKKGIEKYPQKFHARWSVNNAIQDGRLIKKPCEVCGNPKSQAHHEDYSKPLEVQWLCQKHHTEHHNMKPR